MPSGSPEPPAASDDRCWVNNGGFALDGKTHMTGAQIRALPMPSIRDADDLYMEVPGSEDLIVQYDEVVPVVGRSVRTNLRVLSGMGAAMSHEKHTAANGYGRLYDHLDATNGRAIGALIGHRKEPAETIAHRLEIRARILWDMAWAVGQGGPGIPVMRQRNVECAANNLEAAAACIRRLGNFIPRTAKDAVNEKAVEKMALALKMIRDGDHGESYSAGVAMSALASVEEMGLDVS